jgi:FKBP-type peptidyl-prolyl cis-trans isomerase
MEDEVQTGQKTENKYISVVIFLGVLLIIGTIIIFSGKEEKTQVLQTPTPTATIIPTGVKPEGQENMQQGNVTNLEITDLVEGAGDVAVLGKKITVNYKGTLTDGTKFDSSYDRGIPFSFTLGAGEVIQGWDQGFAGMKVGGKRKLVIPPSFGYGSADMGVIPPNSTLIFEVELLKVE